MFLNFIFNIIFKIAGSHVLSLFILFVFLILKEGNQSIICGKILIPQAHFLKFSLQLHVRSSAK